MIDRKRIITLEQYNVSNGIFGHFEKSITHIIQTYRFYNSIKCENILLVETNTK